MTDSEQLYILLSRLPVCRCGLNDLQKAILEHLRTGRLESRRDLSIGVFLSVLASGGLGGYAGAPWWGTALLALIAGAVVAALWFYNRRLPKFRPNEIGVLISLRATGSQSTSPQVRLILESLHTQLRADASMAVDQSRIVVRVVPAHIDLIDHDAAQIVLEQTNGAYIVWAHGTAAPSRNGDGIQFWKIATRVRHAAMTVSNQRHFEQALHEVFELPPNYRVRYDDEIEDTQLVAQNFSLISKYQLGLASAASGRRNLAITLLSACVGDGRLRFQKRALHELAALHASYWLVDGRWPTPASDATVISAALIDAEHALAAESIYQAHALRASCLFLLGDRIAAERENESLKSTAAVLYRLNRAAFALADGNFDRAFLEYQRAKRKDFGGAAFRTAVASSAIPWLEDASLSMSENYLFGLAFLRSELGEQDLARAEFERCRPLIPPGNASDFVTRFLAR